MNASEHTRDRAGFFTRSFFWVAYYSHGKEEREVAAPRFALATNSELTD